MTEYIKHKVADAISSTVADTGKTMSQRITDETCKLLAAKVDEVITKITNGTLDRLRQKIDSEEFSEKFVNVLQQKLIDEMPPEDPFLNKFIKLFDTIIEKAINNYDRPIHIPPEEITAGITDYLQNNVPDFWESNGRQLYTDAVEKVLSEFKTQPDQSQSAFISALRQSVVTPSILGQVSFNSALYDTIEKYKTRNPTQNKEVVAETVPATETSKEVPLASATVTSEPSAASEVIATPELSVAQEQSTSPLNVANKGGRSKKTRKISRKSRSRRNRHNRPRMLTKRNLFL
jgi:hypothetical protein